MASGATLIHAVSNVDLDPDLELGQNAMLNQNWVKATLHFLDAARKLNGELQAMSYFMLSEALLHINPYLSHVARQQSIETFPTCKAAVAAFNAYLNLGDVRSGIPFIELATRFDGSDAAIKVLPQVYAAVGINNNNVSNQKRVFFAFGSAIYWPGFDPMYVVSRLTPENDGKWNNLEACSSPDLADIIVIFQNYPYGPLPDPRKCIFFQLEPPEIDVSPPKIEGALYNGVFDAVNPHWTLKPMHALLNQQHQIPRSKRLAIILSNKALTDGHKARLRLAEQIAAALGDAVDVFGIGLDASKFSGRYKGIAGDHKSRCRYNVLVQYQYVLACENAQHNNYFTEKVMDAWLAGAIPLYWGAPNLDKFVPRDSFIALPKSLENALSVVLNAVSNPPSSIQIQAVHAAKQNVLLQHQMWPVIHQILNVKNYIDDKQGIRKFLKLPEGQPVALCISLIEEVERRKLVTAQCESLGIKVEFVIVKRHRDPVRGCLESHVLAVSIAKQRNYPWVLILEDDVVFTTDWLNRQLYLPPHWEICMLGHNVQTGFLDSAHMIRALGAYTTHAYIMRDTLYDFVLTYAPGLPEQWPNCAARLQHEVSGIDVFYKHSVHSRGRTWAIYPMLATQAPGYSSIENSQVDYTNVMKTNAERAAAVTSLQFWAAIKHSLKSSLSLRLNNRIHTFGDSHAQFGFNCIANVFTHNIGPKLAYSFGKHKLDVLNLKNFAEICEGDVVIFAFGEIDCRCQIKKRCVDDNYQSVINSIVETYAASIDANVRQFASLKTCILSITPAVRKNENAENAEYPFLGTDDERKAYVAYFNQALSKICLQHNYTFIDVHNAYADSEGFLQKDLSDGNVHIQNPVHIITALHSLLL